VQARVDEGLGQVLGLRVPFGLPWRLRLRRDCDAADDAAIYNWLSSEPSPPYDVRLDTD